MNRLSCSRVYLCGAMDRVEDGGKGWRERITPKLQELGIIVIDPCCKPIDTGVETHELRAWRKEQKKLGNWDAVAKQTKIIRAIDLRFVDVTDFIIVYLDIEQYPCGTYEELFEGNRSKKPILIWNPHGKAETPDWLFGTIPHQHIFGSEKELLRYLKHVNTAKKVKDYKRWRFLDLTDATIAALKASGKNLAK